MKAKCTLLLLALIALMKSWAAPPVEEGKALFTARCAACHNINKTLTGPALAGVDQRRSIDWIISFVQSSQSVIKKGDTAAVALFEKFNKIQMPDHADLSGDNIKNIVEYIKKESAAAASNKAPFAKPARLHPDYKPMSIDNPFFIGFLAVVVLLVAVLVFAVQMKQYERQRQEKKA